MIKLVFSDELVLNQDQGKWCTLAILGWFFFFAKGWCNNSASSFSTLRLLIFWVLWQGESESQVCVGAWGGFFGKGQCNGTVPVLHWPINKGPGDWMGRSSTMYVGRFYFQDPLKVVKFWKTIFFTQASFLTRITSRLIRCCSHGSWEMGRGGLETPRIGRDNM